MKDDSMDAVYELRERVSSDLENFIQLMPILIMDKDEDQKMLDYAVDMVKSIKDDLDNAKNVDDVSHTLNMRKLTRDYVSGKLPKMKDANSFIENITDELLEKYGFVDNDGDIEYNGDDDDLDMTDCSTYGV